MRKLTLAVLGVAVCGGLGCLGVEGGIDDPVVSDDPPSQIVADDTGSTADTRGTSGDDSGSTSSDDGGSTSTDDTGNASDEDATTPDAFAADTKVTDTSVADTKVADTSVADTKVADTSVADTSVADTAKPDTAPADTGVTDTGTTGDWPAAYAALEQGILEETNKRRAAGASCGTKGTFGPAGPLVMHPLLQLAARKHSKDMATNNYFSHTNLAGKSPFDRMKAEGYKGGTMGENIAAGNATVAATMDQWMKSDGHCANIMNKSYTQLGVGYWYSASSTYRHYWTQNFGAGG